MGFTRRVFFKGALFTASAAAAGAAITACANSKNKDQPAPVGYDAAPRPLPIPPLLEGEMDGGTRVFKLTAQDGHSEVILSLIHI